MIEVGKPHRGLDNEPGEALYRPERVRSVQGETQDGSEAVQGGR